MMGRTLVHMSLVLGMGVMAVLGVAGAAMLGIVHISNVALWCAVAGGNGKVPDIDHRRSSITKSLGPVTWLLHKIVVWMDRAVYAMTRGPFDEPTFYWGRVRWIGLPFPIWSSSHRRSTHTYPGAIFLGVLTAALCYAHPLVAVVLVALLVLLGGDYVLAVPVLIAYFFVSAARDMDIWAMGSEIQSLAPAWGLAVAVGCVAHCWGDGCTKMGSPLRFPFSVDGSRWVRTGPPIRIGTDGLSERTLVKYALYVLIAYLMLTIYRQWF